MNLETFLILTASQIIAVVVGLFIVLWIDSNVNKRK